mmetsp:Transcript_59322/g.117556  ORF Transcript_59322/g.117556 Transcript_59322/m.117556 type:complete len:412 (+) Transcript_59322:79-1314(+)
MESASYPVYSTGVGPAQPNLYGAVQAPAPGAAYPAYGTQANLLQQQQQQQPLSQPLTTYSGLQALPPHRRSAAPMPTQRPHATGPPSFPDARAPASSEDLGPSYDVKAVPINKRTFMVTGLVLLAMLCFLPVWDSIEMLNNLNYKFWAPKSVPLMVITVSFLILVFFAFTTEAFFQRWRNEIHTAQSLVVMSSLFIMLFGLVLVFVSLPLTQKAIERHNEIVYECGRSEGTRDLRLHYLSLLDLRKNAACAAEYSVENCRGYEAKGQYTPYLKGMEETFRCSGFCYSVPSLAGKNTSLLAKVKRQNLQRQQVKIQLIQAAPANVTHPEKAAPSNVPRPVAVAAEQAPQRGAKTYPPTLFSNANFQASCDGAAARNLINFARDTGYQMWYMGIVLIALAMVIGLWEWTGYAK